MPVADVIDHGTMAGRAVTHTVSSNIINWITCSLRGGSKVMNRPFTGYLEMALETVSLNLECDNTTHIPLLVATQT
jgi:hypothetical protein